MQIPIFYHVNVPTQQDYQKIEDDIRDQLSFLSDHHGEVYVPNGLPIKIENTTLLEHHFQEGEHATLHSVWEYCHRNPESLVVYIHFQKASESSSIINDEVRKMATHAALSDECANISSTCNTCSNRFSPSPYPHSPGNMWLARCEYVKKLTDPETHEEKLGSMKRSSVPREMKLWCAGYGKYSASHWIHSHPSEKPCDLNNNSRYTWGDIHGVTDDYQTNSTEWELQPAPRFNMRVLYGTMAIDTQPNYCNGWGNNMNERIQEYYQTYNISVPSSEWWGWPYFLDHESKDVSADLGHS